MGSAEMEILFYKPWVYFWIVQSLGLLFFTIGMANNISFYSKGKAISLRHKLKFGIMAKIFVVEVLFQKQILNQSFVRWLMHMLIFWGFLGLMGLSALATLMENVIPSNSQFTAYFSHGQGHLYYKFIGDAAGLMVLVGATIAFIRRCITKPEQVQSIRTDTVSLSFLIVLVLTGFMLEAMRLASYPPNPDFAYSFVANSFAPALRRLDDLRPYMTFMWVFHSSLTAALLAYLPHSKLTHMFGAPVEIMLNASEENLRGDLYGQ